MTTRHDTPASSADSIADAEDDRRVVAALQAGDEAAFEALVQRYHASMVRLAMVYVRNAAVAEEVVQETWLGVLRGIGRFEGRSSLKTWIYRILTNRAKSRGVREGRSVSFTALAAAGIGESEPAVDPDRFRPAGQQWTGHWLAAPQSWAGQPEQQLLSREVADYVRSVVATLPATQSEVITLRDIEGWTADEVCGLLEITQANQRVLLHRGRAKVRRALEQYLSEL